MNKKNYKTVSKSNVKNYKPTKKNWQKSPVLSKYTKYNKKICDLFYTLNWEKKTIISLNNSIPPHIICVTFLLIMQLLWSFCLAKKKNDEKEKLTKLSVLRAKKRWYFSLYLLVWSSSKNTLCSRKQLTPVAQKRSFFSKSSLNFFLLFF